MKSGRAQFTEAEDALLAKYIAKYNPTPQGRQGQALYKVLVENVDGKWKWAKTHTWQAWRQRYRNNQEWFDWKIKRYQRKHDIDPTTKPTFKKSTKKAPPISAAKREEEEEEEEEDSDEAVDGQEVIKQGKRKRGDGMPTRRTKARQNGEVEGDISSGEESKRKPPSSGPLASSTSKDEAASVEEPGSERDGDVREGQDLDVEGGVPQEDVHSNEEARAGQHSADEEEESSNSHEAVDPPKQAPPPRRIIPSSHSTPRGDGASIYPNLSQAPSPILAPSQPSTNPIEEPLHVPGAFDTEVKEEQPSQNSHPSQEPTPPLSNKDGSPELGEETSNPKPIRKPVFPKGDYKAGLPVRTDTLEVVDKPDVPTGGPLLLRKKSTTTLKRRRRSGSDEIFGSAPPTPVERTRHERLAMDPLKFVEGPFGSAFVDGRSNARPSARADMDVSDSEEDDEEDSSRKIAVVSVWPPRRNAHVQKSVDVEGKGKAKEMNIIRVEVAPAHVAQAGPSSSSSRSAVDTRVITVKSTVEHHPFSQATQLHTTATEPPTKQIVDVAEDAAGPEDHHHPFTQPTEIIEPSHPSEGLDARIELEELLGLPKDLEPSKIDRTDAQNLDLKTVYKPPAAMVIPGPPSIRDPTSSRASSSAPNQPPFQFPLPREPSSSSSDPFLVSARRDVKGKGRENPLLPIHNEDRRKTFGGFGAGAVIPKVDLTMRTQQPLNRRIFMPVARRTVSNSHQDVTPLNDKPHRTASAPVTVNPNQSRSPSSSPSNLSMTSQRMIMDIGYETIVQRMAENHGFSVEVVKRMVAQVKELELADAVLRKMREGAAAIATDSLQDIVVDLDDEGQYNEPTHESTSRRASGNERVHFGRHSSPRSPPRRESGLHITPAVLDADYSPPETSRASQFARLERQGRRQEALKRESRKVSLGGRTDFLHSIRMSGGDSSRSVSRSKEARVSPESPLGQAYDPPVLTESSVPPSSPPNTDGNLHRRMSNARALDEIGDLFKWCI